MGTPLTPHKTADMAADAGPPAGEGTRKAMGAVPRGDAGPAAVIDGPVASEPTPDGQRRFRTLRRLLRNRAAAASLLFLGLLLLVAVLAPWITPSEPAAIDVASRLQQPSADHWLGTDSLGRDNLSRLIEGSRTTLLAAVQALAVGVLGGIPAGLAAGFLGRRADVVLNWISDVLLSFPPLILALALVGVLGPGLTNAMIAVGVLLMPRFFRVARAAAISVRNETYIEAARSVGSSTPQILLRHALPNSAGPLLVQATYSLGLVVTAEASLSFLGLGAQPPTASWGTMVRDAFDNVYTSTFFLIAPSLMIMLTILAFSMLGDGLRDAIGRQRMVGD